MIEFSATYSGPNGRASVGSPTVTEDPRTNVICEAARRCDLNENTNEPYGQNSINGFMACAMQAVIHERDEVVRLYDSQPMADHSLEEQADHEDAMRCFATALTNVETAQMFARKALAHVSKPVAIT